MTTIAGLASLILIDFLYQEHISGGGVCCVTIA